jgi:hypothetical protein
MSVLDAGVAHSIADLLDAELIRVRVTPDSMTTEAVPSWTVLVPVEQFGVSSEFVRAISVHRFRPYFSRHRETW